MSELVFSRVILEKNNRILMLLAILLVFVDMVLLFAIIKTNQKPPLVVYSQDGELTVLKIKTLQFDENFLKSFVRFIASQYLSFTADSLPKQIESLRPYLALKPAEAILASYKDNQAIIQKDGISQQFVIENIEITKKTNPFWVEIQGTRNIHAAGNDKSVTMIYVMEIKRTKSSESNPYGLLMSDIIEKDKLNQKGNKT